MKKLVFGFIATVILTLNSFGQTKGAEHNLYMDYIYEYFKIKSAADPSFLYDKEKVATALHIKSIEFFSNSGFINDKNKLEENVASAILEAFGEDNFDLTKYNYSAKEQQFIKSILSVLDKDLTLSQAIIEFNSIDVNAKRELSSKEYKVVHSVIDIALHSSEYAYNNIDKWKNLSNNEETQNNKIDWGAVVKADIKGFLIGIFKGEPLSSSAVYSAVELIIQIFF